MKALLAAYLTPSPHFSASISSGCRLRAKGSTGRFSKTSSSTASVPRPRSSSISLYVAGLVYFAVRPGLAAESWRTAALNGALFGFFAYATYDLTSQATLRNWTTTLTVADMAWGTVLSAAAAAIGVAATMAIAGDG